MKKLLLMVTVLAVLVIAGTTVLAHGSNGAFSFNSMLPVMQEYHPDWSKEELRNMYEYCHGEDRDTRGETGSRMGI